MSSKYTWAGNNNSYFTLYSKNVNMTWTSSKVGIQAKINNIDFDFSLSLENGVSTHLYWVNGNTKIGFSCSNAFYTTKYSWDTVMGDVEITCSSVIEIDPKQKLTIACLIICPITAAAFINSSVPSQAPAIQVPA